MQPAEADLVVWLRTTKPEIEVDDGCEYGTSLPQKHSLRLTMLQWGCCLSELWFNKKDDVPLSIYYGSQCKCLSKPNDPLLRLLAAALTKCPWPFSINAASFTALCRQKQSSLLHHFVLSCYSCLTLPLLLLHFHFCTTTPPLLKSLMSPSTTL